MTLIVHTAHISTTDPDRMDVTYKGGSGVFAPSPGLLRKHNPHPRWGGDGDFDAYAAGYRKEMERSQRTYAPVWLALIGTDRVVLTCYCTDPTKCHRTLLAEILRGLGADVRGEL